MQSMTDCTDIVNKSSKRCLTNFKVLTQNSRNLFENDIRIVLLQPFQRINPVEAIQFETHPIILLVLTILEPKIQKQVESIQGLLQELNLRGRFEHMYNAPHNGLINNPLNDILAHPIVSDVPKQSYNVAFYSIAISLD
jgi:hypothetical protein